MKIVIADKKSRLGDRLYLDILSALAHCDGVTVEKEEDPIRIIRMGVLCTPAILKDGELLLQAISAPLTPGQIRALLLP